MCSGAVAVPLLPDVVWLGGGKVRESPAMLTTRHHSPRIRGKLCEACVRRAVLHGREAWRRNNPELQRPRRNARAMIRLISGIKDRDETPSASLLHKRNIEYITSVFRCRPSRWYGQEQRHTPYTNYIRQYRMQVIYLTSALAQLLWNFVICARRYLHITVCL